MVAGGTEPSEKRMWSSRTTAWGGGSVGSGKASQEIDQERDFERKQRPGREVHISFLGSGELLVVWGRRTLDTV